MLKEGFLTSATWETQPLFIQTPAPTPTSLLKKKQGKYSCLKS